MVNAPVQAMRPSLLLVVACSALSFGAACGLAPSPGQGGSPSGASGGGGVPSTNPTPQGPSAPADGGVADGAGPAPTGCAGNGAGLYCGSALGLDPSNLYACDGRDSPSVAEACSEGCNPNAAACYAASCAGRTDGTYCGGDQVAGNPAVLYECSSGAVASHQACPSACIVEPAGTADRCGLAIPTSPRAAAGNGFALVRWSPAGVVQKGFTVTASPGGATMQAAASATGVTFDGLTNGTSYSFTVTEDMGTASAPTNAVTPSASANVVPDVTQHAQTRNLTCEEAALVMALSHEGITKTENEVLADIGIDLTPATFDASGALHWGNPYKSFVGNPDGLETNYTGYGTYWTNIARAAMDFGATVVQAGEAISPAVLYAAILAGHPVVVWVTGDFQVYPKQASWITDDGQTLAWYGPHEHAITVVGVDDTTVVIDNPLKQVEWQRVDRATFEPVYLVYNQMAVILK